MSTWRYEAPIRLAHTDAAGVLYFTRLLELCHEAYETLLAEIDFSVGRILREEDWALPIARAQCDLTRPVFVGDVLVIEVQFLRVGNSSFTLTYRVSKERDEGLSQVAGAQTVHVCIDKATGENRPLPDEVMRRLRERLDLEARGDEA